MDRQMDRQTDITSRNTEESRIINSQRPDLNIRSFIDLRYLKSERSEIISESPERLQRLDTAG